MYSNAFFLAATLAAATISATAATSARGSESRVGAHVSPQISRWLNTTDRAFQARLERAHVPSGDQRIDLRFDIDGAYLRNPQVVRSSGSRTVDASVAKALRSVAVQTPPAALSGKALVVHVPVDRNETASIGRPFGE